MKRKTQGSRELWGEYSKKRNWVCTGRKTEGYILFLRLTFKQPTNDKIQEKKNNKISKRAGHKQMQIPRG
jgi:hypothetical protein